jgi:hypothetical protein
MSMISRIARLASSPQGRRLLAQARSYAGSPEGKAKIEQVRRRLAERRRPRPGRREGGGPPRR